MLQYIRFSIAAVCLFQILLPVRHLLAPKQMASCLCFLGRGTDPAVHELLQHCGNLMTMPQLRQLSLPLVRLLCCTALVSGPTCIARV